MSTTKVFIAGAAVALFIMNPEIPSSFARTVADSLDRNTVSVKHDNEEVLNAISASQAETSKINSMIISFMDKMLAKLDSMTVTVEHEYVSPLKETETLIKEESRVENIKEELHAKAVGEDQHAKLLQQYQEEKKRIELLEQHERYTGDDPIVRRRLNLPPKLPSFEEYASKYNMTVNQFDQKFASKFPE